MNKQPAFVIMAAGMGSRFGGLKQIEPVDAAGHILMDFSIHDALRAGFGKIVFVIKKENEAAFRAAVGGRTEKKAETVYVFQDTADLPEGFAVPEGRVKPWGTGHAVYACRHAVDVPFAVINADDFYGADAFAKLGAFLRSAEDGEPFGWALAGYSLGNTLTENGTVSRGICRVDGEGNLVDIRERKKVRANAAAAEYLDDDGETWVSVPASSPVSLNTWGFTPGLFDVLAERFPAFLERAAAEDPLKAEFFLPEVVGSLLREKRASVRVLQSSDRWYGITYKEDKDTVVKAIAAMQAEGRYPYEF